MPDADLERRASRGEVILGGCLLPDIYPTHHCRGCLGDFVQERDGRVTPLHEHADD
jgi:hypothetical protein